MCGQPIELQPELQLELPPPSKPIAVAHPYSPQGRPLTGRAAIGQAHRPFRNANRLREPNTLISVIVNLVEVSGARLRYPDHVIQK